MVDSSIRILVESHPWVFHSIPLGGTQARSRTRFLTTAIRTRIGDTFTCMTHWLTSLQASNTSSKGEKFCYGASRQTLLTWMPSCGRELPPPPRCYGLDQER